MEEALLTSEERRAIAQAISNSMKQFIGQPLTEPMKAQMAARVTQTVNDILAGTKYEVAPGDISVEVKETTPNNLNIYVSLPEWLVRLLSPIH